MIGEKTLVAYKNRPALAVAAGEKIDITFLNGDGGLRVREKDIDVLFPGPVTGVEDLKRDIAALEGGPAPGEAPAGAAETAPTRGAGPAAVREAWELLAGDLAPGSAVPLRELAELVYGEYSPRSAWGAYLLLIEGLYFTGTPGAVSPRPRAEVEAGEKKRDAKAREGQDREAFLERLKARRLDLPGDGRYMQDLEALAYGRSEKSKTMKELGLPETPEDAHALLLDTGFWTPWINPHPARFGLSVTSARTLPEPPPEEARRDLTALPAFAIDSPWSADPDDAVSVEGNTLYVHVADPAASIGPASPAEREARDRGATLYLPEGASRMLAEEALSLFALGLAETSPALTFKMTLDEAGAVLETEIFPSRVKAVRLSYARADGLMEGGDLAAERDAAEFPAGQAAIYAAALGQLCRLAERNFKRRLAAGAVSIELPETHMCVGSGNVTIEPLAPFRSAALVRECMLLAGEGAALWAGRPMPDGRRAAFPYVSQETGDLPGQILPGLAGAYQLRRCMRPRSLSVRPGRHWGLGLDAYTQVTSPLRRYTDLLAHIQIRAILRGEEPLGEEDVLLRLGAGEAAASATVQAERASRAHWTAVYLSDKKDSLWDAVALEKKSARGAGSLWTVMIPALALETQVPLPGDISPNDGVKLAVKSVNIPRGELGFTFSPAASR
jgi:exoribonuclease-2